MKTILEYLSIKVKPTKLIPKNKTELYKIVVDEIKRLGFTGNFNHIDVSNIEDFDNLFYAPDSFTLFNGDVSEWDVSKMKHCKFMFSCTQFDGDLSQWNVSNCENFNSMFNTTSHFTGKGLEKWNIINAKSMKYMFHMTYSFTGESIKNWKLPSKIEEVDHMFKKAIALETDFSKWDVSNISLDNKSQMFYYNPKMKIEWLPKGLNPDLVDFNTNKTAELELKRIYNTTQKDII